FDAGPRQPGKKKVLWTIKSDIVKIENGRFDYFQRNDAKPDFMDFNYNDMSYRGIETSIKDFVLTDDSLDFQVEHLEVQESCGIRVEHFSANTLIHESGIEFRKMKLITPNSALGNEFIMKTKDWRDYNDFNNKVYLSARLEGSNLDSRDLAYFGYYL